MTSVPPLVSVLLLALLLLVLGGAAVVLISRKGHKHTQPASQPLPELPDMDALAPGAPDAHAPEADSVVLVSGETVQADEVMRILRDPASGALIAQIGARAYRCPPDEADAEFTLFYNTIVRSLSAGPEPAPALVRPAAAADVGAAAPVAPPIPAPAPRSPAPVTASAYESLPGDLPKFTTPDTKEAPRLGRRPSVVSVPEINIGSSIEAFLQYRLGTEAALANRSIHVLPAGEDGVRIDVDG
ncbi:MAG TPA: hypothetical protein VER79_07840, partial [Candidatus Limnocylindrales bacterium]|nr:hypothetical protein [Candidatus Limnocylindrales bacterium]